MIKKFIYRRFALIVVIVATPPAVIVCATPPPIPIPLPDRPTSSLPLLSSPACHFCYVIPLLIAILSILLLPPRPPSPSLLLHVR